MPSFFGINRKGLAFTLTGLEKEDHLKEKGLR